MNKQTLRKLARTDPNEFRRRVMGARGRDLAARALLLHPEGIPMATKEELAALDDYVREKKWRSLYHHDRRMYRLLRAAASSRKHETAGT